jgi:hypothetical protein
MEQSLNIHIAFICSSLSSPTLLQRMTIGGSSDQRLAADSKNEVPGPSGN